MMIMRMMRRITRPSGRGQTGSEADRSVTGEEYEVVERDLDGEERRVVYVERLSLDTCSILERHEIGARRIVSRM